MNTLETLYFPDTTIFTDRQFPIFLLFSPVHILQPVENDTKEVEDVSTTDTFMDDQFCQVHTPWPLGDDKKRFLHLMEDIQNRKDDYAAQLSALTVASMSASHFQNESSKSEIMSSILGNAKTQQTTTDITIHEKLWKARLVLKIGEILDREEEDIANALTFLDDTEEDLFGKLQGKDEEFPGDNPYDDLIQLKKRINPPRRETIGNRMRAWETLMHSYEQALSPIWLTTRQEAADILLERYEKITDKAATPFLTIEFPATIGKDEKQALKNTANFSQEAEPLQAELAKSLSHLIKETRSTMIKPPLNEWQEKWDSLVQSHFPETQYGRMTLSLYLLRNQHPASLSSSTAATDSKNGIVALLA